MGITSREMSFFPSSYRIFFVRVSQRVGQHIDLTDVIHFLNFLPSLVFHVREPRSIPGQRTEFSAFWRPLLGITEG